MQPKHLTVAYMADFFQNRLILAAHRQLQLFEWRVKTQTILLLTLSLAIHGGPVQCQTPQLFEEEVLLNNISTPWGFTFINSDELLFTEKRGKLFWYQISSDSLVEISKVPAVSQSGQGGLLDVALHPDFNNNSFVYLTYAISAPGGQTTALGRGRLAGNMLDSFTELFQALPVRNSGQHFGSRIVFDNNRFLYMSVGDRGLPETAQDKNTHLGKVLRFNDDGTVPKDNPLVGVPDSKPEIYCWGNRNIQGMAVHPLSGEVYAHEHGPRGGDELNLIKPNYNFGWPAVTFGVNYDGSQITPDTTLPGMQLPITYWVPSIAPSGMTFLRNSQSSNEADILIGALAGTHIHWLKIKDNKRVSATRSMNGYARFRDIRQAPDGKIYAMTETPNRLVLLRSNVPVFTGVEDMAGPALLPAVCYPSPMEDISHIEFELPSQGPVRVQLFNTGGICVKEIAQGNFRAGSHHLTFETKDLQPGIYFIKIQQDGAQSVLKSVKY